MKCDFPFQFTKKNLCSANNFLFHFFRIMSPPPFKSRRGGRRPNAGRPKLPTPVKKAARERRLAHKGVARSYVFSKYCKVEEKLREMNARKQNRTERYLALSLQYIKLAKYLNMKKSDILLLGILPEIDMDEEPSASALDTIEVDQLCVSSDEVSKLCRKQIICVMIRTVQNLLF